MGNCDKCGALMFVSKAGNSYCSKKCWLGQPQAPQQQNSAVQPVKTPDLAITGQSIVLNKTEKANSYEFGPANNRHKIYYDKVEDLKAQIQMLIEAELLQPLDLKDGQTF